MGLLSNLSSCLSNGDSRQTNPSSNQSKWSKKQPSTFVEELCHHFSLAQIRAATNNFEETRIIGKGGFSTTYKGHLDHSHTVVAIKRYNDQYYHGLSELKNEVLLLSQLHHPNLMPLIGFCFDRKEMIIVYEHMSNRSLHDHLHEHMNHEIDPLPWKRRLEICIGVARGLHYLHTGAKLTIIHRDLSTKHILLDKNLEAKVSGLLLSKMVPLSKSRQFIRLNSRVMGTFGYADPEYVQSGILTERSDVFSFGMVLLEVMSAKSARDCYKKVVQEYLHDDHSHSLKANARKIIDPFLISKIAAECWEKFIDIAERCLHLEGMERPTMGEVEVELEHALKLQEDADQQK